MTKVDDMTKKYRELYELFLVLQVACFLVPVTVFFFIGLFNGEVKATSKFVLGLGTTVAIIIAAIGIINKHNWRTPIFIFLMMCYLALDAFIPILIVFAICTFLDEMVFTPAYKHYRELYIINREIDKRG